MYELLTVVLYLHAGKLVVEFQHISVHCITKAFSLHAWQIRHHVSWDDNAYRSQNEFHNSYCTSHYLDHSSVSEVHKPVIGCKLCTPLKQNRISINEV